MEKLNRVEINATEWGIIMRNKIEERIEAIKNKLELIPEIHEEIEKYYIYYKEDVKFLLELSEDNIEPTFNNCNCEYYKERIAMLSHDIDELKDVIKVISKYIKESYYGGSQT